MQAKHYHKVIWHKAEKKGVVEVIWNTSSAARIVSCTVSQMAPL